MYILFEINEHLGGCVRRVNPPPLPPWIRHWIISIIIIYKKFCELLIYHIQMFNVGHTLLIVISILRSSSILITGKEHP